MTTFRFVVPGFFPTIQLIKSTEGEPSRIATVNANYTNRTRDGAIILPNGATFDAYQTYDAPIILGDISGTFALKTNNTLSDIQASEEIDNEFDKIYSALGTRGRLVAYPQKNAFRALDCQARLKEFSNIVTAPHDVYNIGPMARSVTFTLVWRQLTEWAAVIE